MTFLIRETITYMIPLMIVALAGIYAERSGVINLALEGIMILGAFIGVLMVNLLQASGTFTKDNAQLLVLLAMGGAALMGAIFSLLLSFAAINLRADQTIGGTALNMLAPALVLFLINLIANQSTLDMAKGDASTWFMLKKTDFGFAADHEMGFLGSIFLDRIYLSTYICIALYVILSIILYRTRFGLRLRACGENPQAANSLGVNVYKMRYIGVSISGALAGLGGFGFLALAVMIFGNWKPLNTAGAALLFGLFKCVAAAYSSLDINGDGRYLLAELGLNPNFYRMLPYLITLIVLSFTSKKSRAPKAEGIPYDKGRR